MRERERACGSARECESVRGSVRGLEKSRRWYQLEGCDGKIKIALQGIDGVNDIEDYVMLAKMENGEDRLEQTGR